jgi:DNA-binding GntR family transcriptional regulator
MSSTQAKSDRLPEGLACPAPSGPEAENRVVASILAAIRDLRIGPGARLVEREIALACGASRLAVRNALLRLADLGLVTLNHHRGATVATCTLADARDVFEARYVVENAILRKLAARADPAVVERLRDFVDDERQAYEANRIADGRRLSREFHLLLAKLAGNRELAGFLKTLIDKQPLLSWSAEAAQECFCGNKAHAEIVEGIASGNAYAAVAANEAHLEELERRLADQQRSPAPRAPKTRSNK